MRYSSTTALEDLLGTARRRRPPGSIAAARRVASTSSASSSSRNTSSSGPPRGSGDRAASTPRRRRCGGPRPRRRRTRGGWPGRRRSAGPAARTREPPDRASRISSWVTVWPAPSPRFWHAVSWTIRGTARRRGCERRPERGGQVVSSNQTALPEGPGDAPGRRSACRPAPDRGRCVLTDRVQRRGRLAGGRDPRPRSGSDRLLGRVELDLGVGVQDGVRHELGREQRTRCRSGARHPRRSSVDTTNWRARALTGSAASDVVHTTVTTPSETGDVRHGTRFSSVTNAIGHRDTGQPVLTVQTCLARRPRRRFVRSRRPR